MDEEEEVAKTHAPIPWIPIVEKVKEPFSVYSPNEGDDSSSKQCHAIPHKDDELDEDQQANRLLLLRYYHQFGHVSFQ
jgi:hypothetical protein